MAERQARARRRLLWGIVKWAAALVLIVLAGLFAYKTGTSLAEIDVQRKNAQIAELTGQVQKLQTDAAGFRAAASQAQQQARDWEQRYKAEMPTGDSKTLLELATRKLNEGVDIARLTFLLNAATNQRVCDDKPEAKRLQVKTTVGKPGKEASAAFADRKITVTAEGQSAVDGNGNKESWFDPARPITLHFAQLDGTTTDASGVVPLQHQLVVGNSEFRFSIEIDDRKGFAHVTTQRCDFP